MNPCECEDRNSTTNIELSQNLTDTIWLSPYESTWIPCCMNGFSIIHWSFRNSQGQTYQIKNAHYSKQKQCLLIKDMKQNFIGTYRCLGKTIEGGSVVWETELKLECAVKTNFIYMQRPEGSTLIEENETLKLCCNAFISETGALMTSVAWIYYIKSQVLSQIIFQDPDKLYVRKKFDIGYIDSHRTIKRNGSCFTAVDIKSCFYIPKMKRKYIGNYTCQFRTFDIKKYTFKVQIKSNIRWLITYGILIFLFGTSLLILLWFFYYDIVYGIYSIIKRKESSKESNSIAIFYDDKSELFNKFVLLLVQDLEKYEIKVYFYLRDRSMGRTIIDEYQRAARNSSLVIFILTSDILYREELIFASRHCIDYSIVIYHPSRRHVKNYFKTLNPDIRCTFEELLKVENWTLNECHSLNWSIFRHRLIKWIRFQYYFMLHQK